jgi:type IV pilus assembly protein PilW
MRIPPVSRSSGQGFSLIEMMVGLMVSAVIVAGSISLLINQQQAYQNTSSDRAGQESARLALGTIGDALRRAGYGIHPSVTFDFGDIPGGVGVVFDSVDTSAHAYLGRDCATPVTCRDNADGPAGSDQIAFYARDPHFVRALYSAPNPTQLAVVGALTSPLLKGQVLAVACGGLCGKRWAYVTVDHTAPGSGGSTNIILHSGSGFDFPYQNAALSDSCFGANLWDGTTDPVTGLPLDRIAFRTASKVFKVDRFRFYVDRYLDPDSGQLRPYLMLDQGLTDDTGRPVRTPVASDIDDLQFAYVFPNAPLVANKLIGATAGNSVNNSNLGIDLTVSPPVYLDAMANNSRATQSPANIRAVRVSVVVRSPEADITLPGKSLVNTYLPAAGNRGEVVSDPANPGNFPDPYHWRSSFESTFDVPNMDSHALSCGDYSDGTTTGLNVGGG